MIDKKRFGLNRIIAPTMKLEEFFNFAVSVGIHKVELRNDLANPDPIDNLKHEIAAKMARDLGLEIISINALQKFNLASAREKATTELKALLTLCNALRCGAVVLCPNNDPGDKRTAEQRKTETIDALKAFGGMFTSNGILGYVEPLGFGISSLDSLLVAQECIQRSGYTCYRIVHDTFHHHIGPDDQKILGKDYAVFNTGLVHISGVESDIPKADYRDEHRVLIGSHDRTDSKGQIQLLEKLGYKGVYSFEPFSPAVQKLSKDKLADAVRKSIDYILA